MCHPAAIPIATAIIGAASSGVQYAGARRQAKQQEAYQRQAQAAERQRFLQEQTSLRMRQAQEQEAVGRELEQVSRKSQAALARARVSAGEAGAIVGQTAQQLLDDYIRQEGAIKSAVLRQQEMGALATGLGLEQAGFATQQRMIGLSQPIDRPSPLGAVLGGIQGGLSGARTGLTIQGMMGGSRPATIDLGGGTVSRYMPGTDQYSI